MLHTLSLLASLFVKLSVSYISIVQATNFGHQGLPEMPTLDYILYINCYKL